MCSPPPGLTDEEIDLAFQQSGTAAEEPASLGPATQVVPVQPPHLVSQPYSKSPTQTPAFHCLGPRSPAKEQCCPSPRLSKLGETGRRSGQAALEFFQKNVTHPKPLLHTLLGMWQRFKKRRGTRMNECIVLCHYLGSKHKYIKVLTGSVSIFLYRCLCCFTKTTNMICECVLVRSLKELAS